MLHSISIYLKILKYQYLSLSISPTFCFPSELLQLLQQLAVLLLPLDVALSPLLQAATSCLRVYPEYSRLGRMIQIYSLRITINFVSENKS